MPIASMSSLFFFNDTATTEIYTLSLHDALPISDVGELRRRFGGRWVNWFPDDPHLLELSTQLAPAYDCFFTHDSSRSEEHTSELQSLAYLVCRLLLEKKKSNGTALEQLYPEQIN